jgi:hypothetical protein
LHLVGILFPHSYISFKTLNNLQIKWHKFCICVHLFISEDVAIS